MTVFSGHRVIWLEWSFAVWGTNGNWPHILILFSLLALQFVVGLGDKVSPTDIEEGMRVGYLSLSLSVMTTVGS
jgi:hypothetical protein